MPGRSEVGRQLLSEVPPRKAGAGSGVLATIQQSSLAVAAMSRRLPAQRR
jgi:hypothetical protein